MSRSFSNAPASGARVQSVDSRGSFVITYTAGAVVLSQFLPNANYAPPSIARAGAAGVRVSFSGVPGRTYTIEFTSGLEEGEWDAIGEATADAQGRYSFIHTPAASARRGFYRARYRVIEE